MTKSPNSSGSLMVKRSAHNRRDTGSSPEQSIVRNYEA